MKVWFNLVNSRGNFLIWRCLKHKKNITHRNNDSLPMYSIFIHWNRNVVYFIKFASLGAASGRNFIQNYDIYLNVGELRKGKFTNITCHFGVTLDVDMPWKLSVSLALCAQHNRSIIYIYMYVSIDGLVPDCSNSSALAMDCSYSSALAMELVQSCSEPPIYASVN